MTVFPSPAQGLPQNREAERAVLGCIFIRPECWHQIPNLSVPMFDDPVNAVIFGAMAMLTEEGTAIDFQTVRAELQRVGEWERVVTAGGSAYLSDLMEACPSVLHVETYAAAIEREWKKRTQWAIAARLSASAVDPGTEPEETALAALTALGTHATREESQARPLIEVLNAAYEAQARRRDGKQDSIALKSGFWTLDGHRAVKRTFVVVGAPSEAGKTAFILNVASALSDHGSQGAIFTLETTEEELSLRYASMHSGVSHGIVQDWRLLADGQFERLAEARGRAAKAHLWLTRKVRTVEQIALETQRLRATEKIDFVMIDYIQLVRTGSKTRDREERIAEISQGLLELSLELGVMVMATSQVTEDWKKRESGRLVKEDLKYARAIAETARVVMMFHRPRSADKTNDKYPWCEVLFQIEKNSENKTSDVPMHFAEHTQKFGEGTCADNDCHLAQKPKAVQRTLMEA